MISKVFQIAANVLFKHPLKFFKNISHENFYKLLHAVHNEPIEEVLSNIYGYFKDSSNYSGRPSKKLNQLYREVGKVDNKKFILLITHESTFTGAPLILLKLADFFKNNGEYYPLIIDLKKGEAYNVFNQCHSCYTTIDRNLKEALKKELNFVVPRLIKKYRIKHAIVNSIEARSICSILKSNNIKVVGMVHELASLYPKNTWQDMLNNCNHLVFPSEFVYHNAKNNYSIDKTISILPQGLLREQLLDENLDQSRQAIRLELGLISTDKIVLSCGSLTGRKGLDFFVSTAISTLNKLNTKSLFFVWVGGGNNNDYELWSKRDIATAGYENNIRLLGPKTNVEPYFLGSDLFFMCSKGDPFPCVVQEAMAAGLPVAAFEGASGSAQLINSNNGLLLPYGDIFAAAKSIADLVSNSEALRTRSINAREYARLNFDFNEYAKKVKDLL